MNSLDLLQCSEHTCTWEEEEKKPCFFRLLAVSNGDVQIELGKWKILLKSRDMLLLHPGISCKISGRSKDGEKIHVYDVCFTVRDPQLLVCLQNQTRTVTLKDFQSICSCMQRILQEYEEKHTLYAQLSRCYFWMILMKMIRPDEVSLMVPGEEVEVLAEVPTVQQEMDMCKVERYCKENYTGQISLEELAALVNLNKTTLLANFKEQYGTTPHHYIIQLRLKKAKELLNDTDYRISEISEKVGFNSVHYFSRFFKEKEQYSPAKYRMLHAQKRSLILES